MIYNFVTPKGVWENVLPYNIDTCFFYYYHCLADIMPYCVIGRCFCLAEVICLLNCGRYMKTFSTDLRKPCCKLEKACLLSINLVLFLRKSILHKLNLNLVSKSNSLKILCEVGRVLAFTMLVIIMWSTQASKSLLFKRCHHRCMLTTNPVISNSVTL